MVWQFPRLRLLCFLLLIVRNEIFPGPFLAASCRSAQDSFTDAVCREAIWQQIVWIWAMFWICCVVSDWVFYERSTGGRLSVGKSSRRRDPVEVLRTFWNIFEYVRFVISCIYSLVCNGIRFIPSQTNVRLGFCDTEDVIWSKYFFPDWDTLEHSQRRNQLAISWKCSGCGAKFQESLAWLTLWRWKSSGVIHFLWYCSSLTRLDRRLIYCLCIHPTCSEDTGVLYTMCSH